MAKQNNKIAQMYSGQNHARGHVFTGNTILNSQRPTEPADKGFTTMDIDISSIVWDNDVDLSAISDEMKESYLEYLVSPIILKQQYEIAEKGGRKFKKKNGMYDLLDGRKRLAVYTEAGKLSIHALIIPIDFKPEDEEKFIRTVKNNGVELAVKEAAQEAKDMLDEEITTCYRYEVKNIDLDKIEERDNKYAILDSEVDELEKSINKIGLLQPIVVLPRLDENGQVKYIIQAGHKRTRAIKQLVKHAKEGNYYIQKIDGRPESELIIERFQTVPALIIPQGATDAEIEQIYNETNLLSRHMTTDDVFVHFDYFCQSLKVDRDVYGLDSRGRRVRMPKPERCDFPKRPSEEEATAWSEQWQMRYIREAVQEQFKKIGFKDWKNSKTTYYLDIYFYGSPKVLGMFKNLDSLRAEARKNKQTTFTQKDLDWISTNYKGNYAEQNRLVELPYQEFCREMSMKRTKRKTTAKLKNEFISQNAQYLKILNSKKDGKIIVSEEDLRDIDGIKKEIKTQQKLLKQLLGELDNLEKEE